MTDDTARTYAEELGEAGFEAFRRMIAPLQPGTFANDPDREHYINEALAIAAKVLRAVIDELGEVTYGDDPSDTWTFADAIREFADEHGIVIGEDT